MDDDFPLGYFDLERFVFRRLTEQEAAAATDAERRQVLMLRRLAACHSIHVDDEGVSYWKCATCDVIHGAPCITLILLAYTWADHVDMPEWARESAERFTLFDPGAQAGGWFALRYPDSSQEVAR